jgi:hypothetical protein
MDAAARGRESIDLAVCLRISREQRHRRGEAVQNVLVSHRPSSPAQKKPAIGGSAELGGKRCGVMIRRREHVRAASVACKQESPGDPAVAERTARGLQRVSQVFVRGGLVAHMELDGSPTAIASPTAIDPESVSAATTPRTKNLRAQTPSCTHQSRARRAILGSKVRGRGREATRTGPEAVQPGPFCRARE